MQFRLLPCMRRCSSMRATPPNWTPAQPSPPLDLPAHINACGLSSPSCCFVFVSYSTYSSHPTLSPPPPTCSTAVAVRLYCNIKCMARKKAVGERIRNRIRIPSLPHSAAESKGPSLFVCVVEIQSFPCGVGWGALVVYMFRQCFGGALHSIMGQYKVLLHGDRTVLSVWGGGTWRVGTAGCIPISKVLYPLRLRFH